MELFSPENEDFLKNSVVRPLKASNTPAAADALCILVKNLHAAVPDKKRISFGIYSIIKITGEKLFALLNKEEGTEKTFSLAVALFTDGEDDKKLHKSKGAALNTLSLCACEQESLLEKVLDYFKLAAASDYWDLREYASGYNRKLIKKYPDFLSAYFTETAASDNPNLRRWVSESMRPVAENRWLQKDPEYTLAILSNLFKEKTAYPRTSVGNNLSDLARNNPERIFKLVEELAGSGDKNSYWIAYRACRNLVKTEPLRVMDLLKVDEYKYKTRIHRRTDYTL